MADQLKLRTFTVLEATPAPIAPSVTPLRNGCAIAAEPLTAEQRDAAQRAMYRHKREAEAYTRISPECRRDVMRGRLLGMARRSGVTSWIVAGRLYRDHGDAARGELLRTWTPDWGVKRSVVDGLLSRAGVRA